MQFLKEYKKFRMLTLSFTMLLPSTWSTIYCVPSEFTSKALDTCFVDTENPNDSLHQHEEVCLHTSSREQFFYFLASPTTRADSEIMGCTQCFWTESAIFGCQHLQVHECQGHTPGGTFSQRGSTTCEIWWFHTSFTLSIGRTSAQASLCRSLFAVSLVCCMGHR